MFALIVTGVLFWICSLAFPTHIAIESFPILVAVSILYFVVSFLVGAILFGLLFVTIMPSAFTETVTFAQVLTITALVVALMFSGTIAILLLSKYLPGFWVDGKLTAFLLSFAPALATAKVSTNRSSE